MLHLWQSTTWYSPLKRDERMMSSWKKYCSKQSAVMHDSLINSSQRETSDDIGEKLLSSKQIFIFHNN